MIKNKQEELVIVMNYYVVDAFTDELFKGNPAGVCLLESETKQNVYDCKAIVKKDGHSHL